MHIMGAFIGINGFEVQHVRHDAELVRDPVTAMHATREPRDVQGLPAIVALLHANSHPSCQELSSSLTGAGNVYLIFEIIYYDRKYLAVVSAMR